MPSKYRHFPLDKAPVKPFTAIKSVTRHQTRPLRRVCCLNARQWRGFTRHYLSWGYSDETTKNLRLLGHAFRSSGFVLGKGFTKRRRVPRQLALATPFQEGNTQKAAANATYLGLGHCEHAHLRATGIIICSNLS